MKNFIVFKALGFRSFVLAALSLLCGCDVANKTCGPNFLVLWPNSSGVSSFQKININTLSSPYEMSGAAAIIYDRAHLSDTSQGFGSPARPHFTRSNDTCVPMDSHSITAVSAYAQFEKLKEFTTAIGLAQAVSWPRKVLVNFDLSSAAGGGGGMHNNAGYIPSLDLTIVFPFDLAKMPIVFNHGILAHEHFHALFYKSFTERANLYYRAALSSDRSEARLESGDASIIDIKERIDRPQFFNRWVIRAWDEGLADVFGALFSNRPDSFSESMDQLENRALNLPIGQIVGPTAYRKALAETSLKIRPSQFYSEGSKMARLIYQLIKTQNLDSKQAAARLTTRLQEAAEKFGKDFIKRDLDIAEMVMLLIKPEEVNYEGCLLLKRALSAENIQKGFRKCL